MRSCLLKNFLIITTIILTICGCDKKLQGNVTDNFGHPIQGAKVNIENSAFTAITDETGAFKLDYAPGQFRVLFSAAGHMPGELELNIAQKVDYPLETAILYRIPLFNEKDVFLFPGENDYISIPGQKGTLNNPFLTWKVPFLTGNKFFGFIRKAIGEPVTLYSFKERSRRGESVESIKTIDIGGIWAIYGDLESGTYCFNLEGKPRFNRTNGASNGTTCFHWQREDSLTPVNTALPIFWGLPSEKEEDMVDIIGCQVNGNEFTAECDKWMRSGSVVHVSRPGFSWQDFRISLPIKHIFDDFTACYYFCQISFGKFEGETKTIVGLTSLNPAEPVNKKVVDDWLKSKGLSFSEFYKIKSMIEFDADGDSENEIVFNIQTEREEGKSLESYISAIILYDKGNNVGKYEQLYFEQAKNIDSFDSGGYYSYTLENIFNADKNGSLDLLINEYYPYGRRYYFKPLDDLKKSEYNLCGGGCG